MLYYFSAQGQSPGEVADQNSPNNGPNSFDDDASTIIGSKYSQYDSDTAIVFNNNPRRNQGIS